jgi:hypothetical protein
MQLKLAQPEIAAAMYARVIATDGAAQLGRTLTCACTCTCTCAVPCRT